MGLPGWLVLIPAKDLAQAKQRLALEPGLRRQLAAAFLADTVSAALRTASVAAVTVLTQDPELGDLASDLGARWVVDGSSGGLNAAITAGLRDAGGPWAGRAVMVGDLPSLRPPELEEALGQVATAPSGRLCVVDRSGDGTTMLASIGTTPITPLFGRSSSRLHQGVGFVPATGDLTGLRDDVDLLADLDLMTANASAGPHTTAVVDRWATRVAV